MKFFMTTIQILSIFVIISTTLLAQEPDDNNGKAKKDINWPSTIVFKSAANAAYTEPYILQKKKIMLNLEEKELEFKNRYFELREQLEAELKKDKPSKTTILNITKELYSIQMKAEKARITARKEILAVDEQMVTDLTKKIETWMSTLKPAGSQQYINYIKKLKE